MFAHKYLPRVAKIYGTWREALPALKDVERRTWIKGRLNRDISLLEENIKWNRGSMDEGRTG